MLSDTLTEFVVKHDKDSFIRRRKVLLLILYIVPALCLSLVIALRGYFPLLIFVALLEVILVLFTWSYTTIEYEMVCDGDSIAFYTIYGHKLRKKNTQTKIQAIKQIVPATEENLAKYASQADKKLDFRSSETFDYPYLLTFDNQKGQKVALLINGYRQLIDLLRTKNFSATTYQNDLPDYI